MLKLDGPKLHRVISRQQYYYQLLQGAKPRNWIIRRTKTQALKSKKVIAQALKKQHGARGRLASIQLRASPRAGPQKARLRLPLV